MKKTFPDKLLILLLILLSMCGLSAVYTATASFGGLSFVKNQTLAIAIGFVLCFILNYIDVTLYKKLAIPIFILSVCLLVAVLIFGIGLEEVGGKSWITIGSFGFQPSEFAKIGFVISFATHLTNAKKDLNSFKTMALLFCHIGVMIVLICLEPDFGTALVFVAISFSMLFLSGLSWKYIFSVILGALVSLPIGWFFLKNYQKQRILVFLNPDLDPTGSGYNVLQSKLAVSSGKLFGQGFLHGKLTQGELLPAKHTDFIFSVIAEEFGFIGGLVIALLLLFLVVRILIIGVHSKGRFPTLVSCGFATMLTFHSFINIGMCMGMLPVTGIPLPFISYGGSSIIANFLAVGVVLGINRSQK